MRDLFYDYWYFIHTIYDIVDQKKEISTFHLLKLTHQRWLGSSQKVDYLQNF